MLEGIRVVDCGINHAGPAASAILADLGADVIHIEQPGSGDIMRGLARFYGQPLQLPGGRHIFFEELNRNKRSVTVDVRNPQGQEIICRLVRASDVLVTNMRPSFLHQVRLDYESLSAENPRLIYAAITGFGERGPEKDRRCVDLLGFARSGIMMASGEPDAGPVNISPGVADRSAGLTLAMGVMAALYARERLGQGQYLSTSLLSSMMFLQSHPLVATLFGKNLPRFDRQRVENPVYSYYRCKDGPWLALALWQEKQWIPFCEAMGMSELKDDPRFSSLVARAENSVQLVSILDKVFASKTVDEWRGILGKRDELLFSVVNTLADVVSDPQVIENQYVADWDHPELGQIKLVGFPVQFSNTPASFRTPAPELGQHTEEVLEDICGYSWEEIARLREDGAI